MRVCLIDPKLTEDKKIKLKATKNAILMRLSAKPAAAPAAAPETATEPRKPIGATGATKKVQFDSTSAAGKIRTPKRK